MKIKNKLILTFLFISFLNIRASHFSPDNEIKTIQTLPRKPQGATLDIEVTKVKTEKINASIDEKNKKIKIDFTDKKNENAKELMSEEKQYDIFVFDNPNDISFFSTTGKKDKRSALKLPKLYDYNVDEKNNNVISINYEEKPEILYIGVRDKSNNEVVKIYNTEITPYENYQVIISNGVAINNPVLLSTASTVYAYPFRKNSGSLIRPEIIKSGDAGDGTQPGTKYSALELTVDSLLPISTYGMVEEGNWTLGNNLTVSGYPLSNFEGISVTRVDRISTRPARLRFMNGSTDVSNNVSYKKWNRSAAANISAFLIQGNKPQLHLLFGMNSWDLSKQSVYTQFAAPLNPPASIGSYQQTYINIPPFDPEAYYDNINSSIKIDRTLTNNGTTNPNMSTFWSAGLRPNYNHPGTGHTGDHIQKTDVQNKTIELGTIKIFNSTDIPQIASDQLGKPLKFHAPTSKITLSDGSGNTITGNIFIEGNLSEITAEEARTVKKVYLELDELKNGTFTTADNTEILRLGLQTDNIFDDIISKITLTMAAPVNVQVKNAINLSNPVALTTRTSSTLTLGEGIYPLNRGGNFTAKNYLGKDPTGYQGVQAIQGYIDGGNLGPYGLIENANWRTGRIDVSGKINNTTIQFLPSFYVTGMSIVERIQDPSLQRSYFRFAAIAAVDTVDPPPEKKWSPTQLYSEIMPFLSESGSENSSYLSFGFSRWNYQLNRLLLKYSLVGSDSLQETYINIPPFEPEAYYDNVNSSIKIDETSQNIDTMNFWSSSSTTNPSYNHNVNGKTTHAGAEIELTNPSNTMIELGTIKARDLFYASDFQGDILKFYTSGSSIDLIDSTNNTNKITGQIIIKVNGVEWYEYAAKELINQSATVYLKLPGALPSSKFGDFVITSDSTKNILRLGLKAAGSVIPMASDIYDDIISKITLKIPAPTPFTVENSIVLANPFAVSNSAAKAYPMNGVGNFYAESSPGGNDLTISPAKGILGAGAQMGSYGLLEDARWKSGDVNVAGDVNGNSFTFLPGDFGNGITKIERIQNSGNSSYLAFKNSTGTEVTPSVASKTVGIINFFLTQYSTPSKHLNVGFGAGNTWNGTQRKITLSIKNSFNQVQKTYIHVPPLDPEAFYDNAGAGIKIDNTDGNIDTLNFWTNTDNLQNPTYVHAHTGAQITRSDVANPGDFSGDGLTINLGTIKSKDITAPYAQNYTLNYFTSSDGIITLTESSTGKTITGRIYIEQDGVLYAPPFELTRAITPRTVYLRLDSSNSLKNGTFTAGSNINILGLGSGSTFDRIIDTLTVTLTKIQNPPVKLESAIVINNPVALAKNTNITYPFKNNENNATRIEPRILDSTGGSTDNNYRYSATRRGNNIGNYGLVNNTEWPTEVVNINGYNPSNIPGVTVDYIRRVANPTNTNLQFFRLNTLQNISGKKWNGNTSSGMGDFLIEGTTNSKHLTMGFSNWDLKEKTFEFIYSSENGSYPTDGSIGYIYITLPPFDPEAYYDNVLSSIKLDGINGDIDTSNYWSSQTDLKPTYTNHIHKGESISRIDIDEKIVYLGTIKILDETKVPEIASDLMGKPLKFYTTNFITLTDVNDSNRKITGKIYIENSPGNGVPEIDAKDVRSAKNVYLQLDSLKKGKFIVENSELLRLGIPTDGIYDDIISKIELDIVANSSFIIDYSPKILDFGAVIQGQFNANEAKTRINITYDVDLNNPSFTYELQRDDGSKANYYNDFKLYKDGDKNSTNFAIADLWLGIEGTPNSNEPNKKTLDLNGKLKNIDNAPAGNYTNTVNIVVTLEEAP